MDLVYAAADLAIARAGALTIAELVACGVPSILIPLPSAAGDHQRKNAREMAAAGVSAIIEESDLDEDDPLKRAIRILRTDEYEQMCQATLTIQRGREAAVDIIARDIRELILHGNTTGENGARAS
jgi:UDP-N-acetylglucosamine--N-acetylmuramyl-(pentapeptide) pyrophosphoryl-undecaprenol N-acetylglucosamine transferase